MRGGDEQSALPQNNLFESVGRSACIFAPTGSPVETRLTSLSVDAAN